MNGRRALRLVLVFSLSFFVLVALGPAALAQAGQIAGQVTDELGSPVAGLTVQLADPWGGDVAWAATDAGGLYAFTGLADGTYLVRASSDPALDLVGQYYPGVNEHDWDLAARLEVAGGTVHSGIDFTLAPAGSIQGTLFGPAAGESVSLQLSDAWSGRYRGGTASDPATGAYVLPNLPAGSYRLFADPAGTGLALQWYDGSPVQSGATVLALGTDQDLLGVDLTLEAGSAISGTVALSPDPGDGGATLERVWLQAADAVTHEWVANRNAAADGTYSLDSLPPGSYLLQAQTPDPGAGGTGYVQEVWVPGADDPLQDPVVAMHLGTPVSVDVGLPATGIDFLLSEGRRISGRVFLETPPADGLQEPGEPGVQWASISAQLDDGTWVAGTGTDPAGDYALWGLPPGLYRLVVESGDVEVPFVAETYQDRAFWENGDPVDVMLADASGVNVGVVQERVISGRVFVDLDGDGVKDPDEPPLPNVTVRAYDLASGYHVGHAAVAGDGRYAIGVRAGRYRVEAQPHQGTLLTEHWRDVYFAEEAEAVDVTAADRSGVDFSLVDGGSLGGLTGRVVAADGGAGLAGVEVRVERMDTGSWVVQAQTDADGSFAFFNLPPSPAAGYRVFFDASRANAAGDTDFVSSYWSADGQPGVIDPDALRVTYPSAPGAGTDLGSFALARGGSISGRVYPPPGETLPPFLGVSAESFEGGGSPLPGVALADDGSYRLRGLPAPATYRVRLDAWGTGLVQVYYRTAAESTFDHQSASAVQVEAGLETGGIDLHPFRGGALSGTVTRASDGSPVAGVPVFAYLVDDPLGRQYWGGHTQTDGQGAYRISGLPSGDYTVRTDLRGGELANQTYPAAVPVSAPDETPGVDFALGAAGRISGRVTWRVDGLPEPVVGIRVEATEYDSGEFVSDAYTASDGTYTIGSLAQGEDYRVRVATQDGHDPQFFNFISQLYDGRLTWDQADRVAVPTDPGGGVAEVPGVDFQLELGGAISGFVRDQATNQPLSGVWVGADDFTGLGVGNGDVTDHNGFYLIRGLPAASYRVRADAYPRDYVPVYFDDVTDWSQATPVSVQPVPAGGPIPITENVDFALATAFRVSGRVTEADGVTPVAGLQVSANGLDVSFWGNAQTDGQGFYEIRGLPAARFEVTAETQGTDYVRQSREVDLAGGSAGGVDFTLTLGARILGRVYEDVNGNLAYDAGEERSGVDLWAEDYATGRWLAGAISGADGLYVLRGLAAGSYRVQLQADEQNFVHMLYDDVFRWEEGTPVLVPEDGAGVPQDVSGIDFRVVRGYEIRGRVFYDADGDGVQDPDEPAVPNAGVRAQSPDGFFFLWTGTEADGSYVLHGAYPAFYQVWVEAQGTPYAGELYKLDAAGNAIGTWRWSETEAVDVRSGAVAGVDFSLELGGGITGVVRDGASGEPIPGIDVWANPFDADGLWGGGRTDGQGRYRIDGLPPGDWSLQTWDASGEYVSEYHLDALFWEDATPVVVAARATPADPLATRVDFHLDRGGAVEGLLYHDLAEDGFRDAGDPPLAGIQVVVEEWDPPNRHLDHATTGADGRYRVGGLPPGLALRVGVRPHPSDFIPVYYDGGDDRGTPDGSAAAALTVAAGGTATGVDFGLALGGFLSGTVRDGDGTPIPGLGVNAQPLAQGLPGGGAQTGVDGRYVIHGLATGDYRVETGGDPWAHELYDDRPEWRLADPVTVTAGAGTSGVDFVLPRLPRIIAGPVPASGPRGGTVTGVTLVTENLTGEPPRLCAATPVPPCVSVEVGGGGVTVTNASLAAATGTLTFDLVLAADAPLGQRTLSLVNHGSLEDGAAVAVNAFEVERAGAGDLPAASAERLYATDGGASRLRVYGGADHSLLGTVEVCGQPSAVTLSPDGSFAFVTCGDRTLSVVDTRLGAVGEEVARSLLVGSFDRMALAATGGFLYATDRETGEPRIQVVDLASWQHTLDVALPAAAWGVRLDPAGRHLFAALRQAHQVAVIDVDPASPGFQQLVRVLTLPDGAFPRGLAFTPDGSRLWVVGLRQTYVLDAAAVLDPAAGFADALVATLETQGSGGGVIDVAHHPASGKDLAYLVVGDSIWVIDATPALARPRVLRTFQAGLSPSGLVAGAGKVYISHGGASLDLYALAPEELLASEALSLTRFDGPERAEGIVTPGDGLAVGPAPASPPAGAPTVTGLGGGPFTNGAPFTVTVQGTDFAAGAAVRLQGTHVRGNVTSASAGELQVQLPATTPTGDHRLVVTNPAAGGGASGLAATSLVVRPPAAYAPNQTLYAPSYGGAGVVAYDPDGSRQVIATQPYAASMALTPDGRKGFVVQLYGDPWTQWDVLPDRYLDVTVVDLDPDSPTYRQVVATVPWVWSTFAAPAVTPDPGNPNGVFVYAANFYMSDTVSVIDPSAGAEVDLDGDPNTQSIPPLDPYTWIYGQKLPGITRIELDGQVTDRSLQPSDAALTPDGNLLYVANRAGSVSVVDTVSHQVVGELTAQGRLGLAAGIAVTPTGDGPAVLVCVTGRDTQGVPSLFVFEAGVLDEAAALVDQIVLPEPELPREVTITRDGETVYLSARYLGELWAVDLGTRRQGGVVTVDPVIHRVPLAMGILEMAEASDDQLLYVSNSFRSEIYVLDLKQSARHQLITTLGAPPIPSVAVHPSLGTVKPQVHRVTPSSGSPAGGDSVVISGANFAPGAGVELGAGNPATGVVVDSASTIRAVTPPSPLAGDGTGAVEVKVINPDGRTGLLQGGFRYAIDSTPPVFTTPPYVASQSLTGAAGAETVTVEVRWGTDEAASSVVDYRPLGEPAFLQASDPALVQLHVVTLTGLAPGTDYELRATSADAQGNPATSPVPPATLAFTTLAAPDVTPPVITSGPTVTVTTDSATLQWQTSELATTVVQWDPQVGDGRLDRQSFGADGTLHSVTLTGLAANTLHEYRVLSFDPSGNGPAESAVATFRTAALPDVTPPVITAGPGVSYLSSDLVIVYWQTDEPATSFVHYGVSAVDEQGVVDQDLVTSHVVFLTNLAPATAYGYQAGSTDPSGNTVLTADPFAGASALTPAGPTSGAVILPRDLPLGAVTLRAGTALALRQAAEGFTTPEAEDLTPPVVQSATATPLAHDRVLVAVETDEAASLEARYGSGADAGGAFEPTFLTSSSLVLTGLAGGTTYSLTLVVTDPRGNAATVEGLTVTTPAAPDTQPPVLTGLAVTQVTATSALLTWQTDEPADAGVRFGLQGGALDGRAGLLGLRTSHSLLLTGLQPATAYGFQAVSRDGSGNPGTATGSFTTLAPVPRVTSVLPARVAQGQSLEVVINGAHFGPDAGVDFGPGVTVAGVSVNATGSQLRAQVTVGTQAPVGERQLVVTTGGQSATAPFAVVDETVPVVTLTEPADGAELPSLTVLVRGTVSEAAQVTVNGVAAGVSAGPPYTFEATVTLPDQGAHRIVATAVDPSGNRGTAVAVVGVRILDSTPPTLELAATPDRLWPPNHRMVPVVVDVAVTDEEDPAPQVVLLAVSSSEPDDAPGDGDGDTVHDVQGAEVGTDDRELLLRAERAGDGPGRVYTLTYQATDQAGNTTQASVEVRVPHDRR